MKIQTPTDGLLLYTSYWARFLGLSCKIRHLVFPLQFMALVLRTKVINWSGNKAVSKIFIFLSCKFNWAGLHTTKSSSPYFRIQTAKSNNHRVRSAWEREKLTIIRRARMGSESIAHEAEGRMGYSLRGHEGERNNCFSKIQLVGQKNVETKHISLVSARL